MSIKAKIEIDNSELKNGLKNAETQASKSMKNVKKTVEGASSTFAKLAASAGNASQMMTQSIQGVVSLLSKIGPAGWIAAGAIAAIGGSVIAAFKGVTALSKKLDSIGKSAKSVNMSTNEYIALQHASSKAGIEMDKTLDIISKIDYAMTHAADGEKKYIDAFHALGIAWKDLEKYSPSRQLMEVADAYKALQDAGKAIPPEIYNIFSRKDMKTLNKMSSANYSQLVAEASVFGLDLNEGQIQLAEEFLDTVGETQERLLKIASTLENSVGLTMRFKNAMEMLNNTIASSEGHVDKKYADKYEGIYDAAKRILLDSKSRAGINDYVKREIYAQAMAEESRRQYLNGDTSVAVDRKTYLEAASRMTSEELDKAFTQAITTINFDNISKILGNEIRKAVENVDSRFKANDRSTWTQAKQEPKLSEEELKRKISLEKAEGSAVRFNKELRTTIDNYENIKVKSGSLINVDEELARINAEIKSITGDQNKELDKELQNQIRINAAKANQLTLEDRIKKLRESNSLEAANVYTDIITKFGLSQNSMKHIIEEFQSIATKLYGNNGTAIDIMNKQLLEKYQEVRGPNLTTNAKSVEDMLKEDAQGLLQAFMFLSDSFKEGIKLDDIKGTAKLSAEEVKQLTKHLDELNKNIKLYELSAKTLKEFKFINNKDALTDEANLLKYQIANNKEMEKKIKIIQQMKKDSTSPWNVDSQSEEYKQYEELYEMSEANRVQKERKELKDNAELEQLELQIANARLQKRYDEEQQLKRILELKKRGLDADIDAVKFQKEFAAQKQNEYDDAKNRLLESITSQSDSALKNLYKVVPNGVSRSVEDMIEKVKEQFKNELPEGLEDMLRKFGNLTEAAGMLSLPKRLDDVIHTNELARRGGFSESVAVERRDNSAQIVSYLSKVNELIKDIKKSNDDISEKMTVKY